MNEITMEDADILDGLFYDIQDHKISKMNIFLDMNQETLEKHLHGMDVFITRFIWMDLVGKYNVSIIKPRRK